MTVVLKKACNTHRTRTLTDDTVVAVNATTNQLLLHSNKVAKENVECDFSLFKDHPTVSFRYDLMDSFIDVCSPKVLKVFTEEFDYRDIREDFLSGVLGSEIFGLRIFTHIVTGEYAARLQDLRTYSSLSKDVMQRWVFPLVPDNNLVGDKTTYKFNRHNVYKEAKVQLARSCTVHYDTAIGAGTVIGGNTSIKASTIGRNCTIGKDVVIEGSYIWDNCVIEDNARITSAILCDGVTVRRGASCAQGTILSFGVVLDEGVSLKAYTKVTRLASFVDASDDDDDDDDDDVHDKVSNNAATSQKGNAADQTDVKVVGPNGVGRAYTRLEDVDLTVKNVPDAHINSIAPSPEALQICVHDKDDLLLDFEETEEKLEIKEDNILAFEQEIAETLARGHKMTPPPIGAIVLELANLKFVHNANAQEYGAAVLGGILQIVLGPLPASGASSPKHSAAAAVPLKPSKAMISGIGATLKTWKSALSKFSKDEVKVQVYFIHGMESICLRHDLVYGPLFPWMLQAMYDQELLSEEALFQWEKHRTSQTVPGPELSLVARAADFLQWLRNAEESDSGSGSSGSDDDDDDSDSDE
jgi:translation initiation factor eIF-2B subunit epsilon